MQAAGVTKLDGDVVGVFVFQPASSPATVLRNMHAMMYSILYGYDNKSSRIDQEFIFPEILEF